MKASNLLGKLLSSDKPPVETIQKLESINIKYWPLWLQRTAIRKLERSRANHVLVLTPEIFARERLCNKSRRFEILALTKAKALLSLKDYVGVVRYIDSLVDEGTGSSTHNQPSKEAAKLKQLRLAACIKLGQTPKEDLYAQADDNTLKNSLKLAAILGDQGDFEGAKSILANLEKKNHPRCFLLKYRLAVLQKNLHLQTSISSVLINNLSSRSDMHLALAAHSWAVGNHKQGDKHMAIYFGGYKLPAPVRGKEGRFCLSSITCEASSEEKQGPLISVIMTCFNADATLRFSLGSLLKQSYKNIEIFVVDDASSDNTVKIIEEMAQQDGRITLIRNEKNSGTYVSKNKAILLAKGKYVTFHDSDDWHHPDRITRQFQALEKNYRLKAVYSHWVRIANSGEFMQTGSLAFLHKNPSSLMVRKEVFDELGYFDSVRIAADGEFIFRLKASFGPRSITELKSPLAFGLQHEQSLTRSGAGAYVNSNVPSPARTQYWHAYSCWHRERLMSRQPLRIEFPLSRRPFVVPESILT